MLLKLDLILQCPRRYCRKLKCTDRLKPSKTWLWQSIQFCLEPAKSATGASLFLGPYLTGHTSHFQKGCMATARATTDKDRWGCMARSNYNWFHMDGPAQWHSKCNRTLKFRVDCVPWVSGRQAATRYDLRGNYETCNSTDCIYWEVPTDTASIRIYLIHDPNQIKRPFVVRVGLRTMTARSKPSFMPSWGPNQVPEIYDFIFHDTPRVQNLVGCDIRQPASHYTQTTRWPMFLASPW